MPCRFACTSTPNDSLDSQVPQHHQMGQGFQLVLPWHADRPGLYFTCVAFAR